MNNNELAHRLSTLSACTLAAAFFFVPAAASAQTVSSGAAQDGTSSTAAPAVDAATAKPATETQTVVAEEEEEEETYSPPLQVGDATSNLFAWQRSGEIASKTTRPIAGSVASRSYERYLKSFEHPIPEHMSSTVKTSTGGAGSK